jgi:hypothetical protein
VLHTGYCYVSIWFNIMFNSMLFCANCTWNPVSARNCHRKFCCKFPRNTVPSIRCIHNLINEVRSTGSLLDKKPANRHREVTKETMASQNCQQPQQQSCLNFRCMRQLQFILWNHVTWLTGLKDKVYRTNYHTKEGQMKNILLRVTVKLL